MAVMAVRLGLAPASVEAICTESCNAPNAVDASYKSVQLDLLILLHASCYHHLAFKQDVLPHLQWQVLCRSLVEVDAPVAAP